MKIKFIEPDMLHPNSNTSIYEVGKKLEKKYNLCQKFMDDTESKIHDRMAVLINRGYSEKRIIFTLENDIKQYWREYINKELHNIKTQSAKKRGGKSFIVTGAYFQSMQIVLEATNE